MSSPSERVVIGMDPHKRSATVEVMSANETIHGGGRFGTDRDGYAAMLRYARHWSDRVWAIEGCAGIGKHISNRLLADGEQVVDVPPKLSAQARVFATGQGRKTDAHSVALVDTRTTGLRPVVNDEQLAVLPILVDRRGSLGRTTPGWSPKLHQLLLELIPGGAKKDLSARNPSQGRDYYERKKAGGKAPMEAMRCVKRRLSDIVYRQLLHDALGQTGTGPGGHRGTSTDSSVTGSHPHTGSSDKSLPGPATDDHTPTHTAHSSPSSPRPLSSLTVVCQLMVVVSIDRAERGS